MSAGRRSPDFKPAGTKSWPCNSSPSVDLKMACCGVTKLSEGRSFGHVSGAKDVDALPAASLARKGLAEVVACEPTYTYDAPSLSAAGLHSIPFPEVSCAGFPPVTETVQMWRRSTSPQLELKSTVFLSGVNDHCSASQLPGVRSFGAAPPSAESAYKCCQPSSSEAITI